MEKIIKSATVFLVAAIMLLSISSVQAKEGIGLKGYNISDYRTVEKMGDQLASSRDELDATLFTLTAGQKEVSNAMQERDLAVSQFGTDSHDAALSEGRFRRAKSEAVKKTLSKMTVLVPKLKAAEEANRARVKRMLKKPGNFNRLIKGHLQNKRNPVVLATLVFLATAKLSAYAENLYGNVLLGKIDIDIKEVQRTMDLVGKLLDPQVSNTSLEEAWSELDPRLNDALSADPEGAMDDLDAILNEAD